MPNRTVCDVLAEIRRCHETRNYSYLMGLIEEVQTMANKMEAGLYDQNDLSYVRKELKKVRDELKIARAELEDMETKKGFLKDGN